MGAKDTVAEDRRQNVKEALLVAATTLIDETQQWTWSIREICDEAHLPYNSFHRTFRQKHALVDALSEKWREELEDYLAHQQQADQITHHIMWLVNHRRRVRFLAAEIGIYEGCGVAIDDLGVLLPKREVVVEHIVNIGSDRQDASRRALAALVFLLGYLSGIDALRFIWSEPCGFPPEPNLPFELQADTPSPIAAEVGWVLANLSLIALGDNNSLGESISSLHLQ